MVEAASRPSISMVADTSSILQPPHRDSSVLQPPQPEAAAEEPAPVPSPPPMPLERRMSSEDEEVDDIFDNDLPSLPDVGEDSSVGGVSIKQCISSVLYSDSISLV